MNEKDEMKTRIHSLDFGIKQTKQQQKTFTIPLVQHLHSFYKMAADAAATTTCQASRVSH
ncbi:hypothetical protein DERF_000501 [Dermatophagoides farinae]|uniref:Uncharacterized protein n=1 Tax=Dermatophagoides farinae TaxID=6954 RepID=A0A922L8P9_DERFA|nr:hypothetical protein DERF_000501 [Dermatophagoides farinae]